MKIGEIIGDSLRYPFTDWKKILIIGFLVLIPQLSYINTQYHGTLGITSNIVAIWGFFVIAFLIGLLLNGYMFRIIKSSLGGMDELPKLNNLSDLFINGLKVWIVTFVYGIPASLIIIMALYVISPSTIVHTILSYLYLTNGTAGMGINAFLNVIRPWYYISVLYTFIIGSILFMAIATMADNDDKLSSAFQISRILDKIGSIGWKNLIVWYLAIFIISGILFLISDMILTLIFIPIGLLIVGKILVYWIVETYTLMFSRRSIALFYMSK